MLCMEAGGHRPAPATGHLCASEPEEALVSVPWVSLLHIHSQPPCPYLPAGLSEVGRWPGGCTNSWGHTVWPRTSTHLPHAASLPCARARPRGQCHQGSGQPPGPLPTGRQPRRHVEAAVSPCEWVPNTWGQAELQACLFQFGTRQGRRCRGRMWKLGVGGQLHAGRQGP